MYAGDGWAGEKVKGQTQDYTNTVQTERLRETLRKEMVRRPRLLPAAAFCSKTLTTVAVWLQRVVARGAAEAMESLKTLRATNREEHQQMLAARRSPRSSVRPSSVLRSHQPNCLAFSACPSGVLSPAAPCSARPPCRGSDTPPSAARSARGGTAA